MQAFSGRSGRRALPWLVGITTSIALFGAAHHTSRAAAQENSGFYIFRGDPKVVSGITSSGWGSGTVEEDPNQHLSGTHSFKIVTHGLYQGANFTLAKPANLAAYASNKNAFLQFGVRIVENGNAGRTASGGSGFMTGGFPGAGASGGAGGGRRGGFPGGGAGFGGAGGQNNANNARTQYQDAKEIQNLRVQLVDASGQHSEFLYPVDKSVDSDGWKMLSIPIPAVPMASSLSAVKEIRLFGDTPGTLYLGQIRVLIDASPITLEKIEDKPALPRNQKFRFVARATGGITPLKVSWDFDETNGIQEEKEGRSITHSFYKSGIFVVTVTVSDIYGVRAPVVRKFRVNVTP